MSKIRVQDLDLLALARLDYGAPSKGTEYLPLQLGPGLAGISQDVKQAPTAQDSDMRHMGPPTLAGIYRMPPRNKADVENTRFAGPVTAGIVPLGKVARHGTGA